MSGFSVDVDARNFQQVVIEGSKQAPVIIDFWAPWCGPCRSLKPILEKLAAEYQGRFTLAKINSDENPELASQFGVRGIPNVKAVSNGKLVNEFTGALPEKTVREFIDALLPSPAEIARAAAMEAYRSGNAKQALELLTQAAALDPKNETVRIDQAEVMIALEQFDEARLMLEDLPPFADAQRVSALRARLQFSGAAADGADIGDLKTRITRNPDDLNARLQLANQCVAARDYETALGELLEITSRDRKFEDDAGRKTMLAVFSLLGNDHELTAKYRRLLASALH